MRISWNDLYNNPRIGKLLFSLCYQWGNRGLKEVGKLVSTTRGVSGRAKTQGARFIMSWNLPKFHNLSQEEWIICLWLGHERLKSPWAVVCVCVCVHSWG